MLIRAFQSVLLILMGLVFAYIGMISCAMLCWFVACLYATLGFVELQIYQPDK